MTTKQQLMETADLLPAFVEEVTEWFDEEYSTHTITETMYNSEMNFNNADKTSGQRCWTEEELHKIINQIIIDLKAETTRCTNCACKIPAEDVNMYENSTTEYGSEMIIEGYECNKCGHKEEF